MQTKFVIFFFSVFLIAEVVSGQQKFEPNFNARRQAIAAGRIQEYLAAMETLGAEAETGERWKDASVAYYEAASAAIQIRQIQKTILYDNKAVELGQKAGDAYLQVNPMQTLANAYNTLGQFEKEKESIEKGLAVSQNIANMDLKEDLQARLYSMLGRSLLRQREFDSAIANTSHSVQILDNRLTYLKRNRARFEWIQIAESNLVGALYNLGNVYIGAEKSQEAIPAFERALTLTKNSRSNPLQEADLFYGLGRAYRAQNDISRALENFSRALQMAESRRRTGLIESTSRAIGDLSLQSDRPSEAMPHYKRAIESIESTRAQLESEEFRTGFFETKSGAYRGMIQAQLASKNFDDAFNYSERARSRSFLDILGSKVQLARSGTLMEHERALHARISVLRAMMEGNGSDAEQGPRLRKELDEARKDYNDYLAKLRKDNKEQASLMSVEPLTIKQVQERLDPGVTMLEYFVSDNNVWLWIVEKEQVQFVSSAIARKDLVTKVTSLRDTIYQLGEKERFNTLSQELHKLLVEPALPHIKGKQLIVVPHDVLHYLPFQALLGSDNRYLIEKYPIYYLSSASLMQFTQEKRRAMGEKVLAFGNPDLEDPKMALQFAEIEAGEIKKLYPNSTVLLKKEATEEKAKSLSPQNDIVHFASHAELNEDDPLASAIRLAKSDKEDGRLEVREIFGMDLKASLVVLSACETGLGKLSSGDELVGLTRAFIYAGTPSVVASLWNVEDSSTAQLMASFYKNLKTMTKVEALRQAQLNLIRGNVNSDLLARRGIGGVGKLGEVPAAKSPSQDSVSISTSHPFFWAPFILVVEGK